MVKHSSADLNTISHSNPTLGKALGISRLYCYDTVLLLDAVCSSRDPPLLSHMFDVSAAIKHWNHILKQPRGVLRLC
jgi:hypothetical protein